MRRGRVWPHVVIAMLLSAHEGACNSTAAATTDEEMARRLLLACLGDAEAGACTGGRVTYRVSERAGYTVQPTRVRTLRWHPEHRPDETMRTKQVRLKGAA